MWEKHADNSVTLTFGDGNAWEMIEPTNDSNFVKAPAALAVEARAAARSSASPLALVGAAVLVAGLVAKKLKKSEPAFLPAGTEPSDSL